METKLFSLEIRENNKLTRIFQVIFGVLCIGIAGFWLVYNFRLLKDDRSLWITVVFLLGFGCYMIWSGAGYGGKFIEFRNEGIRLKDNSIIPASMLETHSIEKIEVYPLKVEFFMKNSKMTRLRFGISNTEKMELIKDEIMRFAEEKNITLQIKNEDIKL